MMNATVRLLIPDKRGIQKRIEATLNEAGAKLISFRLRRELRGCSEAELSLTCPREILLASVLLELAKIPGVALLGSPSAAPSAPASP